MEQLSGSEVSPDLGVTNIMGEYHFLYRIVPLSLRLSAMLDILKTRDHTTTHRGKGVPHEETYSFHLHP
jgi:hypothetical protein